MTVDLFQVLSLVIKPLFLRTFHVFVLFFYSVLEKIIVQGYKALGLQYFFTAGPDEVKAWTIQVKITDVLTTISL